MFQRWIHHSDTHTYTQITYISVIRENDLTSNFRQKIVFEIRWMLIQESEERRIYDI